MPAATPPSFDEARAHRWFAVEANNLGWDLVEKTGRGDTGADADVDRMIHAAHAAWFHWNAVGTPINRLRAEVLLATAYHAAGRAEPAAWHATKTLAALADAGESATPFDVTTAHAAAAAAFALAGRADEAAVNLAEARSAAARLDDADDRAVAERFYPALRPDAE